MQEKSPWVSSFLVRFAHQRFHNTHTLLALPIRLGISRTAGDYLENHQLSKACHHVTCERHIIAQEDFRYSMYGEDLPQCGDYTVSRLTGKLRYLWTFGIVIDDYQIFLVLEQEDIRADVCPRSIGNFMRDHRLFVVSLSVCREDNIMLSCLGDRNCRFWIVSHYHDLC